jgi:hypothetical protein
VRVAIDIGGTFTDATLIDEQTGGVSIAKVLSTPSDPSQGFMQAVERALQEGAVDAAQVQFVVHATTVATNAIIEGKVARSGFVTTEGFRDLIELARQDRPALYDLAERRPEPLVPRELRRLAAVFVGACFLLVVSGTFATAAGPHSGGGKHIDRFASLQPTVYAHAVVVAVFLGAFVFSLGYLAARRERSPRLFVLALGVLALLLVQMGIGELQWRTHLPWGLVLVHVAVAATVWAGIVALATLFHRPLRSLAPHVD